VTDGSDKFSTPPTAYSTPPRDLHPVVDIRFVIAETAKLSSLVDRLVADVRDHGQKLERIALREARLQGAMAVISVIIAAMVAVGGWWISGRLDNVVAALNALKSAPQ